jgi:predicted enzyme related to lactoylglutathione lyase
MARLNLVVLRARNAPRLASFYSNLGLNFVRHRHGTGSEHFACDDGGGVFEIYPVPADAEPTRELRLGFEVADVRLAVSRLIETGAEIISEPTVSPWGLRAVVKDIEGHKVELTEAQPVGSSEHRQTQENTRL